MGKKEKFVFNTQTLSYERVNVTLKMHIWRFFGFFSAVMVTAVFLLALFYTYFPSPREKELLREIDQMAHKYSQLNEQVDLMSKVLTNIQERDASVHRAVFGMDPISENVWDGGIGGHDAHPELKAFQYGAKPIRQTVERVDLLSRQLAMQSKSLDTIQALANNQQQMLACLPSIKPVREDKLQKSMNVLSGFGDRIHPVYKVRKFHAGVDFPARTGTAIQATGDGMVTEAGWRSGYGNCVTINHGYGYESVYAHMNKITVPRGAKVTKGQKIGEVGDTGLSTAPHLHYEVHYKGKPVNPINFCMDSLSPEEYQELVNSANRANQSLD
jgi:hypothetical protein